MTGDGRITEIKRTLDGREQRFDCTALHVTPRLALVRFDHPAARDAGGIHIPVGSWTIGHFWRGRAYNLYRFTAPDGSVLGYRFDVVDGVRITDGRVRFTDLLLDCWLLPGGVPVFEDQDEVVEADEAGLLSPRRRAIIARTHGLLEREHARIIAGAERELAGLLVLDGR